MKFNMGFVWHLQYLYCIWHFMWVQMCCCETK